ncbi:hypothetical protein KXD97_14840 [Mycobacterium sp. SMC-8]|uniref:hypothetical protein n=1 Tax=Mycobacterium sp. SMC-8 TaxID=2857060 RepID=UPI0022016754|nr:hypothetical protein [Mycobacterium sp. SMC-8]UXA14914.1 hypothetical protein KXD97_14840 [Mycobacterium sp. SMC-8]
MFDKARSFVASHRDASQLVKDAEKFAVRLPLIGRLPVPPPDQLAFFGVLGALAAIGAIEWPVAAAIGVGQVVVARHFHDTKPAGPPRPGAAANAIVAGPPPAKADAEPAPATQAPAKKSAAKRSAVKKATATKAAAQKTSAKKAPAKKSPAKKSAPKKAGGSSAS